MKKFSLFLACCLMVIVVFAGCDSKESSDSVLLSVLNSETSFVDESGNSFLLKNYELDDTEIQAVAEKYAFIDFDGDGTNELIAHLNPDYGAYIVFRIYNGKVYGFEFAERAMLNLKKDGTFIQSSGAANNSIAGIEFEGYKYKLAEKAYEDDAEGTYRLNGEPSDDETVGKAFDEQDEKPSVNWTEI